MQTGVFAGSFCPVTVGHVDGITRAAALCDKLYVVVGVNIGKNYAMPDEARLDAVKAATAKLKNVECVLWNGLLTDFCKQAGVNVMYKSVRDGGELTNVVTLTDINRDMWSGETVFLVADRNLRHVSASLVRELAAFGKDYSAYVPTESLPVVKKYF